MITEDHLEKLAISWFQDTGWGYAHGPILDVVLRSSSHERRRHQVTHVHAKCQLGMTLEDYRRKMVRTQTLDRLINRSIVAV